MAKYTFIKDYTFEYNIPGMDGITKTEFKIGNTIDGECTFVKGSSTNPPQVYVKALNDGNNLSYEIDAKIPDFIVDMSNLSGDVSCVPSPAEPAKNNDRIKNIIITVVVVLVILGLLKFFKII